MYRNYFLNDNYVDEEDNNFIAALTGQDRDVWAQVSVFSILLFCKLLCVTDLATRNLVTKSNQP